MNIEFSKQVRDYLRSHPELHSQSVFFAETEDGEIVTCIAGAAVMLSGFVPVLGNFSADYRYTRTGGKARLNGGEARWAEDIAMQVLGILPFDSIGLFYQFDNEKALQTLDTLIQRAEEREVSKT